MKAPEPKSISFTWALLKSTFVLKLNYKLRVFDCRSGFQELTRIFSSLISLCTTPWLRQALTDSTTWVKNILARGSSRNPFSLMKSKRSLQGAGLSRTMTNESWHSKQSSNFTMFGQFLTRWRRQTSSGTLKPFICLWKKILSVNYFLVWVIHQRIDSWERYSVAVNSEMNISHFESGFLTKSKIHVGKKSLLGMQRISEQMQKSSLESNLTVKCGPDFREEVRFQGFFWSI